MGDEEGLTYEMVIKARREEKRSRLLQDLDPPNFFEVFRSTMERYEKEMTNAREKGLDDIWSMLRQDRNTIKLRVSELYALRERKIAQLAALKAEGGDPDTSAITKEEDLVYRSFLDIMAQGRRTILMGEGRISVDVKVPTKDIEEAKPDPVATKNEEVEDNVKDQPDSSGRHIEGEVKVDGILGQEEDNTENVTIQGSSEDDETIERVILLALKDLASFAGYHRDFHIKQGDIFSVPKIRGEILIKTGDVKEVDS